ncbi:unnamed protein product [Lota lota]
MSQWVNQGRLFRSSRPDIPLGYGAQKPRIWIISCTHGGAPRWERSRKSRTCAEEPFACTHPTTDVLLPYVPCDDDNPHPPLEALSFQAVASRGKVASFDTDTQLPSSKCRLSHNGQTDMK